MEQQALGATEMRVIIFFLGLIVLALIYFFGRPKKPGQGKRTPFTKRPAERVEPTLGDDPAGTDDESPEPGEQFNLLEPVDGEAVERKAKGGSGSKSRRSAKAPVGVRPEGPIERIVTLYVCARDGMNLSGSDLVVAAEKAGLEFGDRGIFHRMLVGKPELGPIFSMANMLKPGNFDMSRIESLETAGISLFMTLPGPLPALDAWEAMLPTAQRLAELLDASVLDENRSALGRQGVAHVRDELRAWDRQRESGQIRGNW